MLFFALMIILTLLAGLAGRLGAPTLAEWRACMRWGMAISLCFTGIDHLVSPDRYLAMMPSFVPFHTAVILVIC